LTDYAWCLKGALTIDPDTRRRARIRSSAADPPHAGTALGNKEIPSLHPAEAKNARAGTVVITPAKSCHTGEVSSAEALNPVAYGAAADAFHADLVACDFRSAVDAGAVCLETYDRRT